MVTKPPPGGEEGETGGGTGRSHPTRHRETDTMEHTLRSLPRPSAGMLVKALAVYSVALLALITFVVHASEEATVHERAIIKMALGLNLIWCIGGGTLMYRYRRPIADAVRRIPLPWPVTFVLFCTALALLEEVVTVSMTNLAPAFGSEVGKAFITASANWLHTVLFASVIVFIPMFVIWAWLLRRYAFRPAEVFLLYGLTGSLAEMSMDPHNVLGGFWFFVYGLIVFLPACALPPAEARGARPPKPRHYVLAALLPLIAPVFLLPLAPLLSYLYGVMDPVFFVESPFQ
jgi:hypothetical protein